MKAVAVLLLALLPLAAAAEAPDAVQACHEIAQDRERLECYDAASGRPPPPEGTLPPAPVEDEATRIRSRLDGPLGEWKFGMHLTLQNGQVWKVVEDLPGYSTSRIEYPAVTIEKSFFGSWWMAVEGLGRKLKVQRVK